MPQSVEFNTLRIGVVGKGVQCQKYVGFLQAMGYVIHAVFHPNEKKHNASFKQGGNIDTGTDDVLISNASVLFFSNYEEFLDSVDIVFVTSPSEFHVRQSITALDAGKIVVCEKPAGTTQSELEQLRDVLTDGQTLRRFFIMQCLPFFSPFDRALQLMDEQTLGRIVNARLYRQCSPPGWGNFLSQAAGGVAIDFDIHNVDFMLALVTGAQLLDQKSSVLNFEASDSGTTPGSVNNVFTFQQTERVVQGAQVETHADWLQAPGHFEHGMVLNFEQGTFSFSNAGCFIDRPDAEREVVEVSEATDGYLAMLKHIIACISNGVNSDIIPTLRAIRAAELELIS